MCNRISAIKCSYLDCVYICINKKREQKEQKEKKTEIERNRERVSKRKERNNKMPEDVNRSLRIDKCYCHHRNGYCIECDETMAESFNINGIRSNLSHTISTKNNEIADKMFVSSMFLLHQFNSNHSSDQLIQMDEGQPLASLMLPWFVCAFFALVFVFYIGFTFGYNFLLIK